jgi:hypothetical protein
MSLPIVPAVSLPYLSGADVTRVVIACAALVLSLLVFLPEAIDDLRPGRRSRFADEIERLSEAGGSFDTDNLISNERNYLQVVPALAAAGVSGGAYIGVGPDQNFSYIARIRPSVAYIIDIRRDNLLLHLLFKALFAKSSTRVTYLSLLTGRAPPPDPDRWRTAGIADITAYVDARALSRVEALRRDVDAAVRTFGVRLSSADLRTIDRFHRRFMDEGLDLRFHSFGRPPRPYYPTLRELLTAADESGRTWNYLADERDFQFLKSLQQRDAVVPVVGDVSGDHAMRAIASAIAARGERVSGVYVSNVESYLRLTGARSRFAQNLARLPQDARSVIIRAIFAGGGSSTTVVEPLSAAGHR